jgi:TIR domain
MPRSTLGLGEIYYNHQLAQVFVSYTKDDRALCANFLAQLCDAALKVASAIWYDSSLTPGRVWEKEIIEKINQADIIFVLASPAFLASSYCMTRELPLIRRCLKAGKAAVRVIRLRPCDLPGDSFSGMTVWPEGDVALDGIDDVVHGFADLRTWFKVATCKALVERNSERYSGSSRAEHLATRDVLDSRIRMDDLEALHSELGQQFSPWWRYAAWVGMGATIGAASGAALAAVPAFRILSPFGAVLFASALAFPLGVLGPAFRCGETAWKDLRSGRDLAWPVSALPLITAGGLIWALAIGIFAGFPCCLLLAFTGRVLVPGAIGVAALTGIVGAAQGAIYVSSSGPKRLKVFTDVQHLYSPPAVEPLPSRQSLRATFARQWAAAEEAGGEVQGAAPPEPPAKSPELAAAVPTAPADIDRRAEEVPLRLAIVGAAVRSQEIAALRESLAREGSGDVFRTEIVTEETDAIERPSFWREKLEDDGYCLILMTREIARSALPGAIQRALEETPASPGWDRLFPVLVDRDVPPSAQLMNRQGLPTGQLAIEDWPIRQNAWTNVSRTVMEGAASLFLCRLGDHLQRRLVWERVSKHRQWFSGETEGNEVDAWLRDHLLLSQVMQVSNDLFIDPSYDLKHYGLQGRAWNWSTKRVTWWTLAFAVCSGVLWAAMTPLLARVHSPLIAEVLAWCALTCLFLPLLGWLGISDTLDYARRRLPWSNVTPWTLAFLLEPGRRLHVSTVLRRTARVVAAPLCLWLAASIVSALVGRHSRLHQVFSRQGSAVEACLLGATCALVFYVASRYRMPLIVLRRAIPSPSSLLLARHGWTLFIRTTQPNRAERERARIGGVESPAPRLIERSHLQASFSARMLSRAVWDATWLAALGSVAFIVITPLSRSVGIFASLFLMSLFVRWLYLPPRLVHREKETRWRTWTKEFWRSLVRPALLAIWFFGTLLGLAAALGSLLGGGRLAGKFVLATLWLALFGKRLWHQFLERMSMETVAPAKPGDD